MNYSRNGIAEKRRSLHPVGKRLVTKAGVWLVRLLLVALVAMAVVGCASGWGALKGIIDKSPDVEAIDVAPSGF